MNNIHKLSKTLVEVGTVLLIVATLFSTVAAQTWIQLAPTGTPPSPMNGPIVPVYDPSSNRLIIFGELTYCCTNYNDVWVLSNANGLGGTPTWIPLSPTGGPPASRSGHRAFYDPATNRMTIFGGGNNGIMTVPNNVWVTNANGLGGEPAWMKLSPTGQIPSRIEAFAAGYDPASNVMTIFGGCCGFADSTYTMTNANGLGGTPEWTQISPSGTLPKHSRDECVRLQSRPKSSLGFWPRALCGT